MVSNIMSTTLGYFVPSGYKEDTIMQLLDTKGLYRAFRKYKRVTRKRDDIIFELDDDESAVISCVFQRGTFYVWSPTILYRKNILGTGTIKFAYFCVLKNGLWIYPDKDIREILLQEGDTVSILDTWEEDQQASRESISEMIELYKQGKF